MMIEFLVAGMVDAARPQSTNDPRPACVAAEERAGDSQPREPMRWITNVGSVLALSAEQAPGQRISVHDVLVAQVDATGFWIVGDAAGCRLLVVPAEGSLIQVEPGELIDLQGELRMQAHAPGRTAPVPNAFVYAYIVRRAPPRP